MSTPRGAAGAAAGGGVGGGEDVGAGGGWGGGGGGGRDGGGCSGNLTQSCVLGMTSLGSPCRSPAAWELHRGLERGMAPREGGGEGGRGRNEP